MDALGLEPRSVRLLAKSALLTHLWLRMPSALSRMLVILQRKEPADMKRQLILEKREKWTLWDSNPGPSGYLPNLLTHLWLRMPYGIEPYAYHITKKRTSRQKLPTGLKKGVKWTLWGSNPGPSGYEPDALTN